MADQYARMNTAQLEAEATDRGIPLEEFQQLKNNEERAQRLRDHDAATQATQEQAQANAEQARQAQEAQAQGQADQQAAQQAAQDQARQAQDAQAAQQQAAQDQGGDQGQAADAVQVDRGTTAQADRPADIAPYISDRDQQNRVDAAAGQVTAPPPYDEADVPQVGGQTTPTVDGRDQDLNPDQ